MVLWLASCHRRCCALVLPYVARIASRRTRAGCTVDELPGEVRKVRSIGRFEERPFLKTRNATIDTVEEGRRKHHVPILFEVDVTLARSRIRERKESTGDGLSFTGWIVKCLAQAVSEHPLVHAMRKGRRKMIVFEDVDVSITVERQAPGGSTSETLPMPYVIRKANEKSVLEIHREIRAAQSQAVAGGQASIEPVTSGWMTSLFFSLPQFLRRLLLWRRLTGDPFFAKQTMGTVVVTAVGMYGRSRGSTWAIPVGIHPLVVAVGEAARKPAVVGDTVQIRDILALTVLFDHDVVDGGPVARFVGRFQELLEAGFGLDDTQ